MTAAREANRSKSPSNGQSSSAYPRETTLPYLPALAAVLVFLQLLDWHSTFRAIAQGRTEQNSLIIFFSREVGIYAAVSSFKIAAILFSILYIIYLRKKNKTIATLSLAAIIIPYTIVVINNYSS